MTNEQLAAAMWERGIHLTELPHYRHHLTERLSMKRIQAEYTRLNAEFVAWVNAQEKQICSSPP